MAEDTMPTDAEQGTLDAMEALGREAAFDHPDLRPYAMAYDGVLLAFVRLAEVYETDVDPEALPAGLHAFYEDADSLTGPVAQAAWENHPEAVRAILDPTETEAPR